MTTVNSTVQPFLTFDGRCDEAIDFYKSALDAEVVMRLLFKDNPEPPKENTCQAAGSEEKVMHAQLRIGNAVLMMSDGRCGGKPTFDGISLTLNVASEKEADEKFNALAAGGKVMMPLEKTFFSPRFGVLADKFGVGWVVLTAAHNQ